MKAFRIRTKKRDEITETDEAFEEASGFNPRLETGHVYECPVDHEVLWAVITTPDRCPTHGYAYAIRNASRWEKLVHYWLHDSWTYRQQAAYDKKMGYVGDGSEADGSRPDPLELPPPPTE